MRGRGIDEVGIETTDLRAGRVGLDALVRRLREPEFSARYQRKLTFRSTSLHVNPLMLAASSPDGPYVREWRRHAEECASCASLFEYFDL